LRTSIEKIRRRDLVEAAFQTFLEHGMGGMTVARIGERAGMSHGIVNYYFKNKDALLSAVVRHANCLIMRRVIALVRSAGTPRERLSAVIAGNFPPELFTKETASAWVTFYGAVPDHPDFEKLQNAVYRRLHSNLIFDLKKLVSEQDAEQIALGISVWIDGLWMRCAMDRQGLSPDEAIRAINDYVDVYLERARPARGARKALNGRDPRNGRPRRKAG
jgi:TetR/AcrR family transcriptional regulator, transcriptional repressor of bet genes